MRMKSAYPARRRAAAALVLILCTSFSLRHAAPGQRKSGGRGDRGEPQVKQREWFYDHFDEEHRNAYDAFRRSAADPFGGS